MTTAQIGSDLEQDLQKVFGGDSGALRQFRVRAWQAYQTLPPHRFERSDLAGKLPAFAPQSARVAGDWRSVVAPYVDLDGDQPLLVLADGEPVYAQGLDALPDGVTTRPLREAAQEESVVRLLGSVVPVEENQWTALQSAFFQNGAYVHFSKNATFDGVIQVVHVTLTGGRGAFPRNLIVADEGSRLTVLELYLAPEGLLPDAHFGVTEVVARPGSQVDLGVVANLPKKTTSYTVRRALVERDARVDFTVGEFGDGYCVSEFGARLQGAGSASNARAVVLGSGRAHMDLTAKMVHEGVFSQSDTSARGVMQGRAEGVYRGITHIQKGASGAVGEQAERLLMLSPKSRADAIPMLLIDENDVKCGHAASVGQISEEQLFYLMSRGISEAAAKRMIVWGFLDPVLATLPASRVRQAVVEILERKMNG